MFTIVAAAGIALAALGNGLRLDGSASELGPVASVFVLAVPAFCMLLSMWMAGAFVFAIDPVTPKSPFHVVLAARAGGQRDQHAGVAGIGLSPMGDKPPFVKRPLAERDRGAPADRRSARAVFENSFVQGNAAQTPSDLR
ncbi:hypothetical protein [Nocardia brasiliensis]|uniref:hypothetical protein n=1 Tax=Nocardia brasiliensis TaxID=37326 RepID=UPI0036729636